MIRELFLPLTIGTYRVVSEKIVGLEITKHEVRAALIKAAGRTITIEKCVVQPIEQSDADNYIERARAAVSIVAQQIGSYDQLILALSSSYVVFKHLSLPFLDLNKIALVVGFETEPMLPFPLAEAAIDFVVLNQHAEEKRTDLLVAAVPYKYINEYMTICEETPFKPTRAVVDMLGLATIYRHIEAYAQYPSPVALIDIGFHETRITSLYDGKIQLVRVLTKGIIQCRDAIAQSTQQSVDSIMDQLNRNGIELSDETFKKACSSVLTSLCNDIRFTLTSFSVQSPTQNAFNHIVISGEGSLIPGMSAFIQSALDVPTVPVHIHELAKRSEIILKEQSGLANRCLISIGVALPDTHTDAFNLIRNVIQPNRKQWYLVAITAAVLAIASVTLLWTNGFLQERKLRNFLDTSSQEIITTLRSKFNTIEPEETNPEEALETAQQQLQNEKKLWFAFSSPSFLHYLLELFTRIDKEALGFEIEQLTIAEGVMTLKAHVKDYAALKVLEEDLRQSPLFIKVPGQEDPRFTMKIELAHTNGEGPWKS